MSLCHICTSSVWLLMYFPFNWLTVSTKIYPKRKIYYLYSKWKPVPLKQNEKELIESDRDRVRQNWETNTLLTSKTWVRKRRQQRKIEGQTITTICMEKRACHRLLVRAQNKYRLQMSWHEKYDYFFFPSTGYVFICSFSFSILICMYLFLAMREAPKIDMYVLKCWKNE